MIPAQSFFSSPIASLLEYSGLFRLRSDQSEAQPLFSSSVFSWSSSSSRRNSTSDSNDGVSIRIIGSNEGNRVGSEDDDDDDEAVGSVNEGGDLGSGDSVVSGAKGSAGVGGSDNNTGNARGDSSSYQILPLSLLSLVVFIRQHLQELWISAMNICFGHQISSPPLVFFARSSLPKTSDQNFRRRSSSQLVLKDNNVILKFLTKAASASPSSPAEFPGLDLLGPKPEEKRRKTAGKEQEELVDPELLADPDSCFCEFKGVQIHHKTCEPESLAETSYLTKKIGIPIILLHGFGASVFSWNRVMKPLAQATGSKVLAFDRPAFGLTSRVDPSNLLTDSEDAKALNPYSIFFSVLATLYFVDSFAAEKAIIVGHSAGALVAVETYFKAPERVAAMILVAPAIVPPLIPKKSSPDKETSSSNQKQEQLSESTNIVSPFIQLLSVLVNISKYVSQRITKALKAMGDMISFLYKRALSAFLRSAIGVMLVRMVIQKFGIPAVKNAWFDSNLVTDQVLQGYTKPLRVKGWDRALVEYTIAMLTNTSSDSSPPLAERLSEITCPVLIVTGDKDRLVPLWNSRRLSEAIPGSVFEIIKDCGHLPHEEKVEDFLAIIDRFLQTVFGSAHQHSVQAVT